MQRFAADSTVAETFTDTITYSDTARILQVQRSEVGGEVSDLRDPDARSTLLRVRPDGLSAAGLAGPPGDGRPVRRGHRRLRPRRDLLSRRSARLRPA